MTSRTAQGPVAETSGSSRRASHTRLMRAVLKTGDSVLVQEVPVPEPGPGEVVIAVEVAGVCRTDVYVAQGLLACADPLILGHEFAGVIAGVAPGVDRFCTGDRVAVMPAIPCGVCDRCSAGKPERCPRFEFLGVVRPGAFAEYVAVPADAVHHLPDSLSFSEGAYAEPVCASLAVLRAAIHPRQCGLVYGGNRIAGLTTRVLKAAGFHDVETYAAGRSAPPASDAYDFIVATAPSRAAFDEMIRTVRPGGRIILKSRPAAAVAIDLTAALRKEIVFESLLYGNFAEALDFLTRHDMSDLFGETHPLEDFAEVFAADSRDESRKTFLAARA